MKKIVFGIISLAVLLTACELDRSNNGDLDGRWKVQGIDSLVNGKFVDKSQSQMAFSVQNDLLQLSGAGDVVLCRFEHKGDSLIVFDPRAVGTNNPSIELIDKLLPYGMTSLRMAYHIDVLTSSKMILKTDVVRLYFDKY
ncbi:MAG: lipocalin-like domain-containing protein [Prevotella sp.]